MILHDKPRAVPAWSSLSRRFRRTSHLGSTLHGEEGTRELIKFGARIGLRREWLQNEGTSTEHFDLFDSRIAAAVRAGSTEVTGRAFVMRITLPKKRLIQVETVSREVSDVEE